MSLKITVEIDGKTEQQVAPVIGQIVAHYPGLLSGAADGPVSKQAIYHENPAHLQQQIQQLAAQNKLLQMQAAGSQKMLEGRLPAPALPAALVQSAASQEERWPSGYLKQVVSTSAEPAPGTAKPTSQTPALPTQYRPGKGAVALYLLKRSVSVTRRRLWQLLTWISFGKEWLAVFLLLSAGSYAALKVAPKLADKFQTQPEFVDSAGDWPGEAASEPASEPAPDEPGSQAGDESAEPAQTAPPPSSKAGSHPAPPPAFQ